MKKEESEGIITDLEMNLRMSRACCEELRGEIKRLQEEIESWKEGNANLERVCDKRQESINQLAVGMLKAHKDVNCGDNKAIDYIRLGNYIKRCPACVLARNIKTVPAAF